MQLKLSSYAPLSYYTLRANNRSPEQRPQVRQNSITTPAEAVGTATLPSLYVLAGQASNTVILTATTSRLAPTKASSRSLQLPYS